MKTVSPACKLFHRRAIGYLAELRNKDINLISLTKKITECSLKGEVDYARQLFDEMPYRDCVTWNVMIRSYIENHRIRDAQDIFDIMPERNTVSWNTMIMAYSLERKMHIALKLFLIMPDRDGTSWTTVISGLARDSRITDAWKLFKQLPEPDAVSWSSIIAGFQKNGLASETLILFKDMLSVGTRPTSHSFTSALTASADLAALSIGLQLCSQCIKGGFWSNTHVGNSTISMFVKSGSFDNARCTFLGMPQPDIVSWNAIIVGYGQHGYGVETISMFHQMLKAHFLPNEVSYVGVLQGCSHCKFVEDAIQYFISMKMDYGISPGPEHYACMIDVFSRAGLLKEAFRMIIKMPFEPVALFWRILLSGCRIWGYLQLGVYAADQILKLEPHNSSAYLMVIAMYTLVGRSAEVVKMRRCMREKEASTEMSYSWVEIKGRIYLFTTRDDTHVESDNIYNTLNLLSYYVAEHDRIFH